MSASLIGTAKVQLGDEKKNSSSIRGLALNCRFYVVHKF